MKPEPPAVWPDELRGVALETMRLAKFPMLASIDGDQPRLRPVSPVKSLGFTVWVASLRSSGKTAELERNSRVELCYLAENHDQVRITGTAQTVTARNERLEIWNTNPLLRAYLPSPDSPDFILYRVSPSRVRFMREWALEYHDVPLE